MTTGQTPAATDPAAVANASLTRRADASGQRLFRELVVSRIAWATVSEISRLIACDVVSFALRTATCDHHKPCLLHHCQDALQVKAVLGNRGPRLPGLLVKHDAGIGGRVLDSARPITVADYAEHVSDPDMLDVVVREEGIGSLTGIPVAFGREVRAVVYVGMRRTGGLSPEAIDALIRVCTYSGAAMAAARDRARVEEIARRRERRRLARALHDELGQRLFGIGILAQAALKGATAGRPDLLQQLQGLTREVGSASSALRQTLQALDSVPTPGGRVAVKLREDADAFRERTGISTHLVVLGDEAPLDQVSADTLIRVVQEGLRNAERHARPNEVVVSLVFDEDGIEVAVQDDGVGVPVGTVPGYGMRSLDEELARVGGDLRLSRSDDTGSTLRARVPHR